MFGPEGLTHFVYGALAVFAVSIAVWLVMYSRRQSKYIHDIEREEHRKLGVEEGILLALKRDEELHHHAH